MSKNNYSSLTRHELLSLVKRLQPSLKWDFESMSNNRIIEIIELHYSR